MSQTVALVAGATGLVGTHLIDQLLLTERIGKVIALTRAPLTHQRDRLENRVVDFDRLEEELAARPLQIDEAYCALGTILSMKRLSHVPPRLPVRPALRLCLLWVRTRNQVFSIPA